MPKCKDKRYPNSCAGFCFVQFARRCDAESAQKALNFSEFNGRKIAVDWSLEKDAYVTITSENACKYLICFNYSNIFQASKALKSNNMDDFDSISSSSNINELQRDIKPQNSLFVNKIGNEETSEMDSQDCKTQCTEPIRIRREDPAIAEGRVIFLKYNNLISETILQEILETFLLMRKMNISKKSHQILVRSHSQFCAKIQILAFQMVLHLFISKNAIQRMIFSIIYLRHANTL